MENSFNVKRKLGLGIVMAFLLGLFIFIISSYIHIYKGASISGQVIDYETGEPVKDVNVVVYWKLYDDSLFGGLGGRVPTRVMGIEETITDEGGLYHLSGFKKNIVIGDYMGDESPIISFYKPGYVFVSKSNSVYEINKEYKTINEDGIEHRNQRKSNMVYYSIWDKKSIKIKNEKGDIKSVILNLELVDGYIDEILNAEGCQSVLITDFIDSYTRYAEKIKLKYPSFTRSATFRTNHYKYDQCENNN